MHYLINVLDVLDCLDPAKTILVINEVAGVISDVTDYAFRYEMLEGKYIFKTPQSAGLEVLVTDAFKAIVESHKLKGALFRQVG